MKRHSVQQGDCISSIAHSHGFFWETIWDLNPELRRKRTKPSLLKPGDEVLIPDRREKASDCATDARHRFVRRGTPAKLRLRVMEEPQQPERAEPDSAQPDITDERDLRAEDAQQEDASSEDRPRTNVPYVLEIDGRRAGQGKTDGEGRIEVAIPPDAREGRLILEPGTTKETVLPLYLGHLDPISEVSGVKQRLFNLGFECGQLDDEETPELEEAVSAFQEKFGLNKTGRVDQETRDTLERAHLS